MSKLTREHVTVALSGDGGDELFAGYSRHRFARLLTGTPEAAGKALACGLSMVGPTLWERLFGLLPERQRLPHPSEKIFKAAAMLREGQQGAYRALVSAWQDPETLVKHGTELKGAVFDESVVAKLPDALDRMQYLDAATYLPDDVLTKVDRASMAVALEVRVPLLDHRVVELTWRLPSRLLMRRGKSKWLLRQVLYRHVPKRLVERPKMGFALPIGQWLRGPLRPWAEELLSERRLAAGGLLDPAPILARWREHLDRRRDWHQSLWTVLMFQAWREARGLLARARRAQIAEGHDVVGSRFGDRLGHAAGGDLPISLDPLGEGPRALGEQPVAFGARVFAQRLVAPAAALEKGCGLLGGAEYHGRRGDEAGQERDVVIVAKDLREFARSFGTRVKLGRPARCQKLHLAPMMLHALSPLVEILVAAFGKALLKRLAGRAVAAAKPLGDGTEVVGIDGKPGKGGAQLQKRAHGIRCRALLQILLGRVPSLMQPSAQGLDRALARSGSRLALELIDSVDQGMGVARGCKAACDHGELVGEIGEHRLRHTRSHQQEQRAKALQAFAGAMHAAMPFRRGRQRAVGNLKLAEGYAPDCLAHRHCRIETITHKAPWINQ